ncbi:Acyltransferase family protein [Abditibacterium utsteinense]|uniref:Acyltransferase family protein n=1 Tax=Abditibacterium utsteinense TaxID=1960156 RepID=A0A2S8SWQ6_9BACT|nr:acyltransferase family protein [Abditibacterium utsteinense]PQV65230.1 Acyltransferase family protein [Abditibacterium utsteinense]
MEAKKLEYIDILRGIAIILVVECHSARLVPAQSQFLSTLSNLGTLGVQLFFVASALTLCLSMQNRGTSKREICAF